MSDAPTFDEIKKMLSELNLVTSTTYTDRDAYAVLGYLTNARANRSRPVSNTMVQSNLYDPRIQANFVNAQGISSAQGIGKIG